MRLFDQIIDSPARFEATDPAGTVHSLPGVAAKAAVIAECGLRYVVDRQASQQCFELIREDSGLLDPQSELLRLPAEYFWLEWVGEPSQPGGYEPKMGALIESGPDGRSGSVTGFWQDEWGRVDVGVGTIQFDFDRFLTPPTGSKTVFALRHDALPHLDRLFRHTLFQLDPSWSHWLLAGGGYDRKIRELAEATWHNLPFALAFAAMLNSEGVLDERPSEMARLNRARARRGRPPLLDHIEARLYFGTTTTTGTLSKSAKTRSMPRLHYVRGHFVRRGAKSFWRSAHLRGDCTRPIVQKTVAVRGRVGVAA